MTRFFHWAMLLCLAVSLTAAPQGESGTDPEPNAEVGGMVISAKTGEPLRGVRVTLQPNGRGMQRGARKQTTTDLEGRFLLTQVASGEYTLFAEKTGYETRRNTRIGQLKLAQKESKTKIVISLRPAGVISGRILDSYGEPLAGARVAAFHRNFRPGSEEWDAVQNTTTDDLGEYRLYGLSMGKYIVGVAPRQEPSQDGAFIFEQLPAFYPGVATPEEAVPLKISWGTELDAIDLKLAPAPATAVSGVLADGDTGEALQGYMIVATTTGAQLGSFSTTKDGRFAMYGLPQTELAISGVSRKNRRMLTARGKAHPSESRVEELELLVRSVAPLSGKVVLENPPRDAQQAAAGVSQEGSSSFTILLRQQMGRLSMRPHYTRVSLDDPFFEFQDVQPGEYRVEVRPPDGAYLRAVARSGKVLGGFVLNVPPDGQISDLELRLAFDGGSITGTVGEGASGAEGLGPDARIVVVPDEPETSTAPTSAQVAEDGSFEITAMPPGGYTLFGVESRSVLDLWDPEVRRVLRASGKHVSLDAKETATVELSVIEEPDEPL